MAVTLNPCLTFRDGTRDVMGLHAPVSGGDLTMSTFTGSGGMGLDESEQHEVMHAQLTTDSGLVLMAADVPSSMEVGPDGTISLSGDDEATLRCYWDGPTEGGTATARLEKALWGDTSGMCTDRFGVDWMVNILGS